jgi:hypothetical protein
MECIKLTATLLVFLITVPFQHIYCDHEHISRAVWDEVKPYLLPKDHPATPILDKLFTKSRITNNTQTIRSAGFKYLTKQGQHIKTVRHRSLKGYLIKIVTDNDATFIPVWKHWIQRIHGAELVREGILKYQVENFMVVPNKWIYMLPKYPLPRKEVETIAKHFVLVVEDLNILDDRANQIAYRKKIKNKHLRALFNIVTDYGLKDSCSIDKIPWNKKNKISFINTECVNIWPVDYKPLLKYLDSTHKVYWQKLIKPRI